MSRGNTFQPRVEDWMEVTFGQAISTNRIERCYRFFEEGTELVQAGGMSREDAHRLVDYVYGRPVGELPQEIGGTMVTIAALCSAFGIQLGEAAEAELQRCWENVEKIRAKQAQKAIRDAGRNSPLPGDLGLAPNLRPCICTTRCLHRANFVDPPEPVPPGVVCRERSALPRLSEGPLRRDEVSPPSEPKPAWNPACSCHKGSIDDCLVHGI